MKISINGNIRELTPEEIAQRQAESEQREREEWASISYKDAIIREIRKKYDECDELAIQRQKDRKPEEFKEYDDYCEYCKAYVKEKLGIKEG